MAAALGLAQRGERVGGFAGLRDDEQHGVVFERRVAVTKFVRELDLHRDLCEFFNQIFADQRGVPARAAGGNDDAFDGTQLRRRQIQAAEFGGRTFLVHAPAQGVLHRLRLLKNFLEHEVRVLAARSILLAELKIADLKVGGVGTGI